jgi:16S rRNA (cytosine967-C5)-methyltransferase
MAENQRLILEAGAEYVKRGGALVYSVCTINPAEGSEMIGRFLGDHPDFSIDDISPFLDKASDLIDDDGTLFTPPYIFNESDPDKPDGFFAARLKRK